LQSTERDVRASWLSIGSRSNTSRIHFASRKGHLNFIGMPAISGCVRRHRSRFFGERWTCEAARAACRSRGQARESDTQRDRLAGAKPLKPWPGGHVAAAFRKGRAEA
jgi:hypothetical protein